MFVFHTTKFDITFDYKKAIPTIFLLTPHYRYFHVTFKFYYKMYPITKKLMEEFLVNISLTSNQFNVDENPQRPCIPVIPCRSRLRRVIMKLAFLFIVNKV